MALKEIQFPLDKGYICQSPMAYANGQDVPPGFWNGQDCVIDLSGSVRGRPKVHCITDDKLASASAIAWEQAPYVYSVGIDGVLRYATSYTGTWTSTGISFNMAGLNAIPIIYGGTPATIVGAVASQAYIVQGTTCTAVAGGHANTHGSPGRHGDRIWLCNGTQRLYYSNVNDPNVGYDMAGAGGYVILPDYVVCWYLFSSATGMCALCGNTAGGVSIFRKTDFSSDPTIGPNATEFIQCAATITGEFNVNGGCYNMAGNLYIWITGIGLCVYDGGSSLTPLTPQIFSWSYDGSFKDEGLLVTGCHDKQMLFMTESAAATQPTYVYDMRTQTLVKWTCNISGKWLFSDWADQSIAGGFTSDNGLARKGLLQIADSAGNEIFGTPLVSITGTDFGFPYYEKYLRAIYFHGTPPNIVVIYGINRDDEIMASDTLYYITNNEQRTINFDASKSFSRLKVDLYWAKTTAIPLNTLINGLTFLIDIRRPYPDCPVNT